MSGAGELVSRPALRGEVVPPASPPPNAGGGSVYADFVSRLRNYVAPPPPGELGWQAAGGVGMALGGAGLLALLPAGHTIASGGVFRWVSASGVAATADLASVLVEPLALFGMVMLLGIAAVYLTEWGATPALIFLTAQTWLGVAALAVAVIVWVYLLAVFVINLVIWVLYIMFFIGLAILALMILRFFADS